VTGQYQQHDDTCRSRVWREEAENCTSKVGKRESGCVLVGYGGEWNKLESTSHRIADAGSSTVELRYSSYPYPALPKQLWDYLRLCPLVLCLGLSSFQTNNKGFDLVSSCDYDVRRVRNRPVRLCHSAKSHRRLGSCFMTDGNPDPSIYRLIHGWVGNLSAISRFYLQWPKGISSSILGVLLTPRLIFHHSWLSASSKTCIQLTPGSPMDYLLHHVSFREDHTVSPQIP